MKSESQPTNTGLNQKNFEILLAYSISTFANM